MQASRQNPKFVYLEETKILILHLVAFYPATKFRNIMNDLQTQFEHSMFNSGCLKMTEIETFILLPWQVIYPSSHTQKLLFKSTVTFLPNMGLLHLQIAEI